MSSTELRSEALIVIGLIAAILTLLPNIAPGQNTDFRIEDYIPEKFRDLSLTTGGNLYLTGHDTESEYLFSSHDNLNKSQNDNQNGRIFTNLACRYETVPRFFNASIYIDGDYIGQKDDDYDLDKHSPSEYYETEEISKINEYTFFALPQIDIGYYLFDDFFISSSSSFGIDYRKSPHRDDKSIHINSYQFPFPDSVEIVKNIDEERRNGTLKDLTVITRLLPGWGHIYEGKYASAAIYIIDELRKDGYLLKQPSNGQMSELAAILYQAKMEHYFDFRLHDIDVNERISSYLISQGLIEDTGFSTALLIHDVWKYYPAYNRRFGLQFKAGVGIEHQYEKIDYDYTSIDYTLRTRYHPDNPSVIDTISEFDSSDKMKNTAKFISTYPYAVISADFYKPINHKWQLNISADASYYFKSYHKSFYAWGEIDSVGYYQESTDRYDLNSFFRFYLSSYILYILSSRTYSTLTTDIGYDSYERKIRSIDINPYNQSDTTFSPGTFDDFYYGFNWDVTYRISIPVTLTVEFTYASNPDWFSALRYFADYNRNNYAILAALNYQIL